MKSIKIGISVVMSDCMLFVEEGSANGHSVCIGMLNEECWCKENLHPSKLTWIQEQVCLYDD